LFDVDLGVGDFDAQADVNAGGRDVAVLCGGAGLLESEVEKIFEVDAAALEGGRFRIRQIVGDNVNALRKRT
jgi:hypothetical protein